VTPQRCYLPPALAEGGRIFGPALQLYGLRSDRNFGIGDLTDLGRIVDRWRALGADLVSLSPLHALDSSHPERASPYSPSSRCFANWLFLDPAASDDFAECEAAAARLADPSFAAELARVREAALVDYTGVAALKREILELLYASFRARHLATDSSRAREFRAWRERSGVALERFALFEALRETLHRADPSRSGWRSWPESYRDPRSATVATFAEANSERIGYFAWLQWQLELQLEAVARRAGEQGMAVGLYADLAVSIDGGGADAWADQDVYALSVQVGAPPDEFSPGGQAWGLPPPIPERLAACGYAPFIATLRAAMKHARALRIDHVMQLARLFWIPEGGKPGDGAYVRYPLADLLGLVALESVRHRCLVIGEDLGTVSDDLRRSLADAGVLSTRLLWFERDEHLTFKPPSAYPRAAAVAVSSHDLPTLAGWWKSRDLAWRTKLALFTSDAQRDDQMRVRRADRNRLAAILEHEQLAAPAGLQDTVGSTTLATAAHAFLARSPAMVMLVQLEDLLGLVEQANLPGTVDEHPNWRRRLPLTLDAIDADPQVRAMAAAIARERRSTSG
jgi:(1->4)-alpha-D-glucan 1-alpha-D-glucosylmutase